MGRIRAIVFKAIQTFSSSQVSPAFTCDTDACVLPGAKEYTKFSRTLFSGTEHPRCVLDFLPAGCMRRSLARLRQLFWIFVPTKGPFVVPGLSCFGFRCPDSLKPTSESCVAALKHVVEVGSEATEFGGLQVLPQFLLRKGLVTAAYQHADFTTNNTTSPLTRISVGSADMAESSPVAGGAASSEDYALLVQSLAEDGNPGGLTALGDLYFHGHEAGMSERRTESSFSYFLSLCIPPTLGLCVFPHSGKIQKPCVQRSV